MPCICPLDNKSPLIVFPDVLPSPFNNQPAPIAIVAAESLQRRLIPDFNPDNNKIGNMFGVLVIKDSSGKAGYISAQSKTTPKLNDNFFVPPLFDNTPIESNSVIQELRSEEKRLNLQLTEINLTREK